MNKYYNYRIAKLEEVKGMAKDLNKEDLLDLVEYLKAVMDREAEDADKWFEKYSEARLEIANQKKEIRELENKVWKLS